MKRSEMLTKIAVAILEADTNEMIHGENEDMSYEEMARIALKACEKEGMKPPYIKYSSNDLSYNVQMWEFENETK